MTKELEVCQEFCLPEEMYEKMFAELETGAKEEELSTGQALLSFEELFAPEEL